MSSTRPAKCLVCEHNHSDWDDFYKCESIEMFDVLLDLGTVNYKSIQAIRQLKGEHDEL